MRLGSGSDDAPAKVIELGSQCRGEARPGVVLFLGKLVDLPGDVLRDGERDLAVVAPLPIFGDAIDAGGRRPCPSCNDRPPNRMPVVRLPSGSGNTWLSLRSGVLRIVLRTPLAGVSQSVHSRSSNFCTSSEFNLFHGGLILRLQVAVQSDVLVDRQGLSAGVPRDQLKLSISQATECRVSQVIAWCRKVCGVALHASLLGVLGDDLLDPPRAELAVPLGLEEPAVMRVGGDVRSQSRGEALAEEDVAVLASPCPG